MVETMHLPSFTRHLWKGYPVMRFSCYDNPGETRRRQSVTESSLCQNLEGMALKKRIYL